MGHSHQAVLDLLPSIPATCTALRTLGAGTSTHAGALPSSQVPQNHSGSHPRGLLPPAHLPGSHGLPSPPPRSHAWSPFPTPKPSSNPHRACCLGIRGVTLVAGVLLLRDSRWGVSHMIPAPKQCPHTTLGWGRQPLPSQGCPAQPQDSCQPWRTHPQEYCPPQTHSWTDTHTHTPIHTSPCITDRDRCRM